MRRFTLVRHDRRHLPGTVAVACVAACMALATACDEDLLPPVTPADSAGTSPSPDTAASRGPALITPALKRFDPNKPRTADRKADHVAKLLAGEDFDALELRSEVELVSQRVADETMVAKDSLSMPFAGNEALLDLPPGCVLIGDRASAGRRTATGSNNILGFMRKMKSVSQVGDKIVVETEPARLEDALAGAVQLSFELSSTTPLDTTGVDLNDFIPGLSTDFDHNAGRRFDQRAGAWGKDGFAGVDWSIGGSIEFPLGMKTNFKELSIERTGAMKLKAEASAKVGLKWGFDIDTPVPNVWDSKINYVQAILGGWFEAEIAADLSSQVVAVTKPQDVAELIYQMKVANPLDAVSGSWTLGTKGPYVGPSLGPIPTTVYVELLAACTPKISGTMNVHASVGVSGEASFGFRYSSAKGVEWPTVFEFKRWKEFSQSNGQVSFEMTCTVGPRLHWLIAGVVGPYLDAQAAAKATVNIVSDCPKPEKIAQTIARPASLFLGIDVGVIAALGGSVTLAIKNVGTLWQYDFGSMTLFEKWFTLFSKSFDITPGYGDCPSYCDNGQIDPEAAETDVDCGGFVCKPCAEGQKCGPPTFNFPKFKGCQDGLHCFAGKCSPKNAADPCNDGKFDPNTELDLDCGGLCGKCMVGQKCVNNDGCLSGICEPKSGKCATFNCNNGVWDPDGEGDVDCGKTCPKPCGDGQRCRFDADCNPITGSLCVEIGTAKFCVRKDCATMGNKKKDGLELGDDCGGKCAAIKHPPGLCHNGLCGDQVFKCKKDEACVSDADCWEGNCVQATKKCGVPKCFDKVLTPGEGDVDCGGPCAKKCQHLQKCNSQYDCDPNDKTECTMFNGVDFKGPRTCRKYWENGSWDAKLEPSKDCGGSGSPNKCKHYDRCWSSSDCATGLACLGTSFNNVNRCLTPGTCSDAKVSGFESDVDCGASCGGSWATQCAQAKICRQDADCRSGMCLDTKVNYLGDGTPGACGSTCKNDKLDPLADEGDVDCGGPDCPAKCGLDKTCKGAKHCASGLCSPASWRCVEPQCNDGLLGGDETDVDCGGGCTFKCGMGKKCKVGGDCFSGLCGGGKCQPPPCENGKHDDGEADVDCGGKCGKKCLNGAKCAAGADCKSGQCLKPEGQCGFDLCRDGVKSGAESDVDCGGGCKDGCALGKGCATGKDCGSGFCDGKTCVASACMDKQWSPGESDVDCGGTCAGQAKCAVGKKCKVAGDCASGFCDGAVCVASACADKKLSAGETDVDCGGACAASSKCALAHGCKQAGDCQSNVCNGAVCVSGSCFDLVKTDGESDVDCGGACKAKCSTGSKCAADGDCGSGMCSTVSKTCVNSHCDDGKLSGDETDVDCGGACKTDCLAGAKCKADADCFSQICAVDSAVCVTSTCFDEKLSGDEKALDCGGSCAAGCAAGTSCDADDDCVSLACAVTGTCAASHCDDGKQSGDETAVDCGGACDAGCAFGLPCKVTSDCDTGACGGDGKCACPTGLYWEAAGGKCADCACAVAGSAGVACDAKGACACKPGWGATKCDVKTDVCKADALDCDDKVACTADSCDPKTGCKHDGAPQDGKACDDGNACTTASACKDGKCAAVKTVACFDDGDPCTAEACDPADGKCHTVATDCDDGDPCTADACDAKAGCTNKARPDGATCGAGTCLAGKCACRPEDYAVDGACVPCGCHTAGVTSPFAGKVSSAQLLPAGVGKGMGFGQGVAASPDRLIVNTTYPEPWPPQQAPDNRNPKAFIYERDASGNWKHTATVQPPCPANHLCQQTGASVAISGDIAAVSTGPALKLNTGGSTLPAAIQTYRRQDDGTWVEDALLGRYVNEYFTNEYSQNIKQPMPWNGRSLGQYTRPLSLSGDTLAAVGFDRDGTAGSNTPFVDIYVRGAAGWTRQASFTPALAGETNAVIEGDRLVIAGPGPYAGVVDSNWVYERKAGTWQLVASLVPSQVVPDERLGSAVAMSGDRIALATAKSSSYNLRAVVFDRRSDGSWVDVGSIVRKPNDFQGTFGTALALSGDRVLVTSLWYSGGPGAVHVHGLDGGAWKEVDTWTGPAADNGFGRNIAVAGGAVVLGSQSASTAAGTGSGVAFLYTASGGSCDAQGKCACNGAFSGDKCAVPQDICAAEKLVCDDGNACTKDACDPKKGCTSVADAAAKCDDGDACTAGETCEAGVCKTGGEPKVCADDGDVCTVERCDVVSGACLAAAKVCDDGKPCTDDVCAKGVGCEFKPSAFGELCGGGSGKCQGETCVCAPGTWLAGSQCAACGCDATGSAVTWTSPAIVAEATDLPLAPGGQAGKAVATAGNYAVVGLAGKKIGQRQGVVAILERQPGGGWQQVGQVQPQDEPTLTGFGAVLAMDGARFIAGIPDNGAGKGHGEAGIWERAGDGTWARVARLLSTAKPSDTAKLARFGAAVAMSGDHALCGAPNARKVDYPYNAQHTGRVHAFTRSNGTWQAAGTLHCAEPGVNDDQCGAAVALSGTWAAIGAPNRKVSSSHPTGMMGAYAGAGAVRMARLGPAGWAPAEPLVQPMPGANYHFGQQLALEGGTLLVATASSAAGTPQVVLYALQGGAWEAQSTLAPPIAGAHGGYGSTLAVRGAHILVGAPTLDNVGAAWLYDALLLAQPPPVLVRPASAGSGAQVGAALAVGDHELLIGAPGYAKKNAAGGSVSQTGAGFFLAPRGTCDAAGACACKDGFGGKTCALKTDVCKADALNCDDGNACTTDSCDPVAGCQHAGDDAAQCDDGDACTAGEACKGGACAAPAPKTCADDGDPCTSEFCAAATGACAVKAKVCDDGDPCTLDACEAGKGCNAAPMADGAACGGAAWEAAGVCSAGVCACAVGRMLQGGLCVPCACQDWDLSEQNPPPRVAGVGRMGPYAKSFGRTLDVVDGTMAADIARPSPGGTGYGTGAVQIFTRTPAGTWQPAAEVQPDGVHVSTFFGRYLAAAKGRVAAVAEQTSSTAGGVFVFAAKADGSWQKEAVLYGAEQGSTNTLKEDFGTEVAMDGTTLVASGRKHPDGPRAYVFERLPSGWQQTAILRPTGLPATDFIRVAVAGDWAAVGDAGRSRRGDVAWYGSVAVYQRLAAGTWVYRDSPVPPGPPDRPRWRGVAVALHGDMLMIGGRVSGELYRLIDGQWQYRSELPPIPNVAPVIPLVTRLKLRDGFGLLQYDGGQSQGSGKTTGWLFRIAGDSLSYLMPINPYFARGLQVAGFDDGRLVIGDGDGVGPDASGKLVAGAGRIDIWDLRPRCKAGQSGCFPHAACSDAGNGTVKCVCQAGYNGDGSNCVKK